LWEPSFCFKNPIVLGYTRGHFTALVHMERSYINPIMSTPNVNNSNLVNSVNSTISGTAIPSNSNCSSDMDNHLYCGAIVNDLSENCASGNGSSNVNTDLMEQTFYLPLTNSDGQLLPMHFLTEAEVLAFSGWNRKF
jgi:hypothetical protein